MTSHQSRPPACQNALSPALQRRQSIDSSAGAHLAMRALAPVAGAKVDKRANSKEIGKVATEFAPFLGCSRTDVCCDWFPVCLKNYLNMVVVLTFAILQ